MWIFFLLFLFIFQENINMQSKNKLRNMKKVKKSKEDLILQKYKRNPKI